MQTNQIAVMLDTLFLVLLGISMIVGLLSAHLFSRKRR